MVIWCFLLSVFQGSFGAVHGDSSGNSFSFSSLLDLIPSAHFRMALCFFQASKEATTISTKVPNRWKSIPTRDLSPPLPPSILSRKYGSFMMIHLGSKPILVASSAEVAREIMKTHDLAFSDRAKITINDRLLYGCKDVAAAPYGEYWRQVRSICVIHLLSTKRVQSYRKVREEETSIMIEKIRKRCSSSTEAINLSEILVALTDDVICRIVLGRKYGDDETGRNYREFFTEFGELLGTFDVGDYIPWLAWLNGFNGLDAKVERVVKQIDGFLGGVVEEHRNRKKGDASIDQSSEEILFEL